VHKQRVIKVETKDKSWWLYTTCQSRW